MLCASLHMKIIFRSSTVGETSQLQLLEFMCFFVPWFLFILVEGIKVKTNSFSLFLLSSSVFIFHLKRTRFQ